MFLIVETSELRFKVPPNFSKCKSLLVSSEGKVWQLQEHVSVHVCEGTGCLVVNLRQHRNRLAVDGVLQSNQHDLGRVDLLAVIGLALVFLQVDLRQSRQVRQGRQLRQRLRLQRLNLDLFLLDRSLGFGLQKVLILLFEGGVHRLEHLLPVFELLRLQAGLFLEFQVSESELFFSPPFFHLAL
mgnify:CR=1 FL=1